MTMQDEQEKIIHGDGATPSGRVLVVRTPMSRQNAFAYIKNWPALPMNLTDEWIPLIIASPSFVNGPMWFYSYNANTYNGAFLVLHPTGLITALPVNLDAECGVLGYLEE
ncbi:hypothetical protein [Nonomuraea sp. NEAU-A123]|uniref:hypothetical protein n=1 Tax=Nonomuraea sp. NEAU-A123 TaxID=2839649 RepID=UPI001BE43963|nr:hypothetical protein [Nonomuraea sp. NEAU-A123]MBT2227800.1 hypothetical protein [Nonomuraea sp. NEAU-A123]